MGCCMLDFVEPVFCHRMVENLLVSARTKHPAEMCLDTWHYSTCKSSMPVFLSDPPSSLVGVRRRFATNFFELCRADLDFPYRRS